MGLAVGRHENSWPYGHHSTIIAPKPYYGKESTMNHPSGKPKAVGIYHAAFGTICCPECHMIWPEEFVPEYCTKCGIRVAEKSGECYEPLITLMERARVCKIISCPQCGVRYPRQSCPNQCFRCQHDLSGMDHGDRARRTLFKLRHLFRG